MGPQVVLVSSAEETAQEVYRTLVERGLERPAGGPPPRHRFLTTGDPETFTALARRFLGPEVALAESAGLLAAAPR
jgi:glutamate racemase